MRTFCFAAKNIPSSLDPLCILMRMTRFQNKITLVPVLNCTSSSTNLPRIWHNCYAFHFFFYQSTSEVLPDINFFCRKRKISKSESYPCLSTASTNGFNFWDLAWDSYFKIFLKYTTCVWKVLLIPLSILYIIRFITRYPAYNSYFFFIKIFRCCKSVFFIFKEI